MTLRTSLMLRISLAALTCLLGAIALVAFRAQGARDEALRQRADRIAAQVGNQLTTQTAFRGTRSDAFGDLGALLEGGARPGQCAALMEADGSFVQRHCVGSDLDGDAAPAWFASLFAGAATTESAIVSGGARRGAIVVEEDPRHAAVEAWGRVAPLVGLSAATVAALWVLVYAAMGHALRPLQSLSRGLARLEEGTPGARLDGAGVNEFARIAESFNRLAGALERRTAERDALTRRLVDSQEEERRHLARELHDEFGQCLVAINALAASIVCSTFGGASGVADEARRIQHLVAPMMQSLRAMLLRLQPPGIDEFGLESCLRELVAQWNGRGPTSFALDVSGSLEGLSRPVAVNLYRVVQESLTNAVKHAAASRVSVRVQRSVPDAAIRVTVEDDGRPAGAGPQGRPGFGIPGMRERVAALGGRLDAGVREPRGFVVSAWIPIAAS